MLKLTGPLILGILSGLLGCIFYLTPQGWHFEEDYGLHWLFKNRGVLSPPNEAAIIAIDRESTIQLGLPVSPNFWPWPREVHANLIDRLAEAGAEIIVLDLIFHSTGTVPEQNQRLAEAIKKAGNVIIVERLDIEHGKVSNDEDGSSFIKLIEAKSVPLLPEISAAVLSHAPFPLPTEPPVNAFWTFKTDLGDTPTIPTVVFQAYALNVYEDFLSLLRLAQLPDIDRLPQNRYQIHDIEAVILFFRQLFINQPNIKKRLITVLQASTLDIQKKRIIQSLINLYSGANAHFLNFYGYPRSIHTIPAYQVLQFDERQKASWQTLRDQVKGKVVFVGLSAVTHSEIDQIRDTYHTVFTDSEGLEISGVEIAATAFANLLHNNTVRPLPYAGSLGLLFVLGLALGMILPVLSNRNLIIASIAATGIYIFLAWLSFKQATFWLPLVTPVFIVIPCAVVGAVVLKYLLARQERDELLELFGKFTPDRVIDDLTRHLETSSLRQDDFVFGACLFTDIEGYTSLAEKMDARQLQPLLDEYFDALSSAVRQNNGIVSEKIGDAMLAIWEVTSANKRLREQACEAGLAIMSNVNRFNSNPSHPPLSTRIGIHFGQLLISRFGSGTHKNYIYRVIGDLVNTTSRIETINKRLGTRLLVSQEVISGIDRFLTRPLGSFVFAGKSKSIQLSELISHKDTSKTEQVRLCELFSAALTAYEHQQPDTIQKWKEILEIFPNDGPSQFYLAICLKSPPDQWDSVIKLTDKS